MTARSKLTTITTSELVDRREAESPPASQSIGVRLLLSLAAGALLASSFPPYRMPFLLPAGFALLVYALDGLRPRHGFYLGFAAGVVYFGATLFWLSNLFGAAAVSLIAIAAAFPLVFGVGFTFLRRRLPRMPLWILAPVLWTGIEYFRSEPFPLNFGWMGLGYGAVNSPLVALIASWVGCYGVTFAIALIGVGLWQSVRSRRWSVAIVVAAVWLALLNVPLPTPRASNPLRVRMVQAMSDDEEDLYKFSRESPDFRPDIVLWPEYSLQSDPTRDPKVWSKLREFARTSGAFLIFGAKERIEGPVAEAYHNTAFVLDSSGEIVGRHYKNHPVHFIKDGVAGEEARARFRPRSAGLAWQSASTWTTRRLRESWRGTEPRSSLSRTWTRRSGATCSGNSTA